MSANAALTNLLLDVHHVRAALSEYQRRSDEEMVRATTQHLSRLYLRIRGHCEANLIPVPLDIPPA